MKKKPASDVIEQTWEHLGVTITFSPTRAAFLATAAGKDLRAASLDAIKAQLDKLNVAVFEPFDAYVQFGGYGKPDPGLIVVEHKNHDASRSGPKAYLLRVKIVGLDKSDGRTRFRYETPDASDPRAKVRSRSENELDDVYPATQATIDLWLAHEKARFARDKATAEHDEIVQAARDKLLGAEIKAHSWRAVKS